MGYTVTAAETPQRALSLSTGPDARFDLPIGDVMMPGLSGLELKERVQAVQPGIRALYMSGYAHEAVLRDCGSIQGVPFIQKPFDMGALAEAVRNAMNAAEVG